MPYGRLTLALTVGFTLAFTPAVSAQGHFAQRDAEFHFSDVSFPSVVDTFLVLDVHRWPAPSAGVALKYRTPLAGRAAVDLYVYPAPPPDADGGDPLQASFDEAVDGMREYARREGVALAIDTAGPIRVTASGKTYDGWLAETTFDEGSEPALSRLYLFTKDGWLLKYRITYPRSLRRILADHVDAFIEGTLARVEGAPRTDVPGG